MAEIIAIQPVELSDATRLDRAVAHLSALRNEISDVFPAAAELQLNGIEACINDIRAKLLRARLALNGTHAVRVVHPRNAEQTKAAPLRFVPPSFEPDGAA